MDFLTELAKEAVTKLGDLAVESAVKQFKYLTQHKKITANLKEELEELKMMKQALQARVTTESRKGNEIDPSVQKWLSDVAAIENELHNFYANEVNKNKKCFAGHCPDLAFNYSLGKRAAKSTEYITSLKEEENKFRQAISYAKAPSSLGSTFTKDIMSLVSREKIITQVIDKLKDDQVNMISICGMGGVGKTTLVKELIKTIEKSKLFDEVVMAVVSQDINYEKIQIEIAEMLGMECKQSMQGRAIQLLERLRKANSRVLIVLDDVWEELDFERIGLPYREHEKACKILFTSREEKVCQKMGSKENIFKVSVLSENEAWCLFQKMAGEVVDEPDINPIAREVSKECGGLPLAIVTVGTALSNEGKSAWEDALGRLRSSQSSSFLDVEKIVYPSIELSFNFLGSREHKFFLMLCVLFPEDFDIPIESLLCHAMGLGLFKDIGASWRARNRMHTLVGDLKRKFLLLDSNVPGCVKMHDVVRDVVISLVFKNPEHGFMVQDDMKKLKEEKLKDIIAISLILDDKTELENGLECPILQLLQVRSKSKEPIFWPELFFQGMRALKVLSMQNLCISKLPSLSRASVNLHTLQVEHCDVGDISIIGNELIHLQVLSFAHSNIKELPTEIGNLGSLKLLDLTECNDLNFISANVLIRLTQLEELYFRTKNFPWKKNDVMINELKNMSRQLKLVEMKVRGTEISAIDLNFKNLEKFWVYVDPYTNFQRSAYLESNLLQVSGIDYKSIKSMLMILQLVNKCEILAIRKVKDLKNVISQLGEHLLPHLKDLRIDSCPDLEYLIDCTVRCNAFPQIQSLSLKKLNNLREICYTFDHHEVKASMIEFPNLVKLELIDLPSLIGFSKATDLKVKGTSCVPSDLNRVEEGALSMVPRSDSKASGSTSLSMNVKLFSCGWMHQFPKLETILVKNCSSINMVFDIQGYSDLDGQVFPQLKEIKISRLEKLTHVWSKAMHGVQVFQNLRSLAISKCDSLRHVFTPTIVRAITKIEKMEINSCKLMENIVGDDEEGDHKIEEKGNTILFEKLEVLKLRSLPSTVGICANGYEVELPSLRELAINNCPKLNISSLLTPNTKHDNLAVSSCSNTNGTEFSNFEENYSSSCNWHLGCMPLIRQRNTNKKSNKAPSISEKKIKVEVGRAPLLEELFVSYCDLEERNQTRIRGGPVIDGLLFPNLKSLTMESCDVKVSVLLSPSSSTCLEHLEELRLQGCKDLNEIVSQEEIEACGNKIIFPALRHLSLQRLRNFKAFCLGSYDFDFPSLQKVVIVDCPNMDVFSRGSSHTPKLEDVHIVIESLSSNYTQKKNMNATIQGFKAFVALQKSDTLSWTDMHNKNMFGSTINVTAFNRLSVLVSLNEIQMLHQVKSLTISDCNSLVEVFESGGEGGTIRGDVTTTHYQLQEMTLDNLPKLSHICKHNIMEVVSFQKLTSLDIDQCHSLKTLLSFSMARSLVQLKTLVVSFCDMMEEIVSKEDENIEGGSKVKILFPQLEMLTLVYLPKLECFCSGEYDYDIPLSNVGEEKEMNNNTDKVQISFPKLEALFLREVPKLKCFCAGAYDYDIMVSSTEECPTITTFPHGNVVVSTPKLHLLDWDYTDMRTLGDLNLTIHYIQNSEKYKVELQKLETFRGIERDERLMAYIKRVTKLCIGKCHKLLNCIDIPSNMMHLFSHVDILYVREIECLEEIFESSDYEGDNMTDYELRDIELSSLPKLKHIWKNHGQVFGFQNLQRIRIDKCHDLKYVFPNVSTATSLPSLYGLDVYECNKMEEIVGNNYNPSISAQEQQHAKIIFPHLATIWLKNLPSLKCFGRSSFPCYVELPQCYGISIEHCPEMKTFWYDGTLYTPRLLGRYSTVENTEFDTDEELNEVIRHSKRL